jgi:LacI family transcriptional regulator
MSRPPNPNKSRPATLADVGREAGVSAMAASVVLNGGATSSRISEATRERILNAAKKLNYRANLAARALVSRRMNTLGVTVIFDSSELNLFFLEVFNGIIEAANARGQNTTVFTMANQWDFDRIQGHCDGRIDGMILIAPFFETPSAIHAPVGTPFVAVNSSVSIPGILDIICEEESGAHEIACAMLTKGHRRILHMMGPQNRSGARQRRAGFLRAMKTWGIPNEDILETEGSFSTDHTRFLFNDWLDANRGQRMPDAILCANDACAIGCREVLITRGYRIPEDVSLCGFDDTLLAKTTDLSSVKQPLREMGNEAVVQLLKRVDAQLQGQPLGIEHNQPIVFPTHSAIRGSMGQPAHAPVMIR